MTTIMSLLSKLELDTGPFKRSLEQAQATLKSASKSMSSMGKSLTVGVTMPLVGIGTAAVKTAADFESQMNIMAVAARSSGTALDVLRDAAIRVGGDTELVGINASQAAEAMTNFYKAGLSTSDMFGDLNAYLNEGASLSGALRAAIDLQAASELDLAQASDVVSVAMATFGLDASEATHIADSFVRAADASVASVGELADALVNVGPTAASFGWSLDDVNTALALLSQRGIKGAEAGTALKSMITNLMRPTDSVTTALEELNVALYDEEGHMRSLPDIMADLERGLAGVTEEQRNQYIQTLAGTYGMKAMNTLLAEGKAGWDKMSTAIGSAATVQETAAARTRGLHGAWETLSGLLETFMIRVGTPLVENTITPMARRLTTLMERVMELDPKWIQLGTSIAIAAAAAGPMLVIAGQMAGGLSTLISLAGVVGPAIGSLSVPILLVVGVLALLAAAWINDWGGIRETTSTVVNAVRDVIVSILGGQVMPFIQSILGILTTWWTENYALIQQTTETVLNAIQTVITAVLSVIQAVWSAHGDEIMRIVGNAWIIIQTTVETTIRLVLGIIRTVMQLINGDWSGAWETIKSTASTVWDGIKAIVGTAADSVKTAVLIAIGLLRDLLAPIWDAIKTKVDNTWRGIKTSVGEKVAAVKQAVLDKIKEIKTWLGNQKSRFVALGSDLINGLKNGVLNAVGGLISAVTGAVNDAIEAAKRLLGIGSPSRLAALQIGVPLATGIGVGFEKAMGPVTDALQASMASLMRSISAPSPGTQVINNWNINANYSQYQSERSLRDTIKLLQMGYA